MKKPKFTGPKKNHSAIFLGEPRRKFQWARMRIIYSNGFINWIDECTWDYPRTCHEFSGHKDTPCYWTPDRRITKRNAAAFYRSMRKYDYFNYRETIFLGYVKDTE